MAMCILKYNGISEFPTYRTSGLHYRQAVPTMGWYEDSRRTAQNRHPVASIQYPASTVVSSWGPQQVGHIQPQLASVARRALKGTVDQLRNAVLCGIGGVLEDTHNMFAPLPFPSPISISIRSRLLNYDFLPGLAKVSPSRCPIDPDSVSPGQEIN